MTSDLAVKAIVQKVIPDGNHGPYAVATTEVAEIDGSVTFSLEPTVWQENELPEEGMFVYLEELRLKRSGWRAKKGRFWKPSDEQIQQRERSSMFTFLYPTSRQYPIDDVCDKIVRELEKRNWQAPGITVEFNVYGAGKQKYRHVATIKGLDFKLWFCRVQRLLPGGNWNDIAAVSEVKIPGKEMHVYEDESGPTYYHYVGDNWERDREAFMNVSKVNSKLKNKPRLYLQYSGAFSKDNGPYRSSLQGTRRPYLVHTNDLGREYDPEGKEPKFFWTADVMADFTRYLKQEVLEKLILSQPIPAKKIDIFAPPPSIPFPQLTMPGRLFTFGDWRDVQRIKQGKADPAHLPLSDYYGMQGNGWRLVSWEAPNDGTVPKIAYDGFLWCGFAPNLIDVSIDSLEIPRHFKSQRDTCLIGVNPNRANDIYIADMSGMDEYRERIFRENPKLERLTEEQYHELLRIPGRTIIPITEYRGGFKQPVALINRELELDEVEIIYDPEADRARRRS